LVVGRWFLERAGLRRNLSVRPAVLDDLDGDHAMKTVYQQPIPTREERAEQLRVSERAAERDRLKDMLVTIAGCFFFMIVGLFLMAWALHTTDEGWGRIFFWAALAVNNAGVLGTLLFAYRRGQERGDW
jgi:hypothetical protein